MEKPNAHKPLFETHPHLSEFLPFLEQLNKESPRGAVLIACSFLDQLLEESIREFLLDVPQSAKLLNGFNAPLGSFAARVTAAYCLGVLEEAEYEECERLRRIRNHFAHTVAASFDDPGVIDRCKELTYSAKPYEGVRVDPFGQFTTSAIALVINLTNRPYYVARQRLRARTWKR